MMNHPYVYPVVRSTRRRTIGAVVRPDGTVEIRVPAASSEAAILRAIAELTPWIERRRRSCIPARQWVFAVGERYYFLGREYELERYDAPFGARLIVLRGERLLTPSADAAHIRRELAAFYQRQARRLVTAKVEELTRRFGITVKSVTVNGARRRYGSCGADGRLNFAWSLAMLPEPLIELVAAHELAHRRVMNHSAAFYAVLESLLGDCRARTAELRRWSRRIPAWPAE